MPNPKFTFRIWPKAQDKLWDECKRYKGDKPPIRQFVSRLILMCPQKLWEEVRAEMDQKFEEWD